MRSGTPATRSSATRQQTVERAARDPASRRSAPDTRVAAPSAMVQVSIVDDDALVAEGIASLLSREGFEIVAIAGSVSDALASIRSTSPDVILADVMLAGQPEGLRLPAVLAHAGIRVPVIFVSNYALPHFIAQVYLPDDPDSIRDGILVDPVTGDRYPVRDGAFPEVQR